ncbi:MAG TPA: NADPH-dependent F420 reductase [Steroidobacteraceae bacterium]|jgi:NADPH-dependent F420 reductase|nr:NADPH-dependent F420 reductase [Steroidobacteraceae bacterium]
MAAEESLIAVVGGTGNLGAALARRWVKAGLDLIIGSRDALRAAETAAHLTRELGRRVDSASNRDAAERASLVVVTVPYAAQSATLTDIRPVVSGKVVLDTTVPLLPPKVMRVQLPEEGAAALRAQRLLGPSAVVVSAFHNVAAHRLATGESVDCDVLVFGDDRQARARVVRLAQAAGLRGLHGGPLANSAAAEALTSVLIFVNKTYAVDGAGVRLTGNFTPPADE